MDGERQWLIFLGAVLLVAFGSIADGPEGAPEIKSLCDGEVIGVQFQKPADRDPFVCVLDPQQNHPQTLGSFLRHSSIMQHDEKSLRRIHDDIVFDVRLITRPSHELDMTVFALNVINGTILFLDETQCLNDDSPTRSVQFLLKDDCDCQPKAPESLVTPTPVPFSDNDCVFHNGSCRLRQLCDGEITGVQFEYSGNYRVCIFDHQANMSYSLRFNVSEKVQRKWDKVLNFENATISRNATIFRLNVRMIDNSTWGLDPAFAFRLSDQTVLFIVADGHCVINNTINEDSEHSPVKFVLAGNGSCNCDSGLRTSSIVTTTAPLDISSTSYTTVSSTTGSVRTSSVVTVIAISSAPYTTPSLTEDKNGPSIAAGTVLGSVGTSISTITALVLIVLLMFMCINYAWQIGKKRKTRRVAQDTGVIINHDSTVS